jgi:toxin ParE1/3/4
VGAGLRWSRNGRQELNEIRAYIERDSKANAVHVVGQFLDAADRLEMYPLSGHVIETWNTPERRELIVGSYRLMYHVSSSEIIVFSVRHTRRRVPKRFRSEWLR